MSWVVVSLTLAFNTKIELFFAFCASEAGSFNRIFITITACVTFMDLRIIKMRYHNSRSVHLLRLSHPLNFLLDHSLDSNLQSIIHGWFLLHVFRLMNFLNRSWLNPTFNNFKLFAISHITIRNLLSLFETRILLQVLLNLDLFLVAKVFLIVDETNTLPRLHLLLS